jgi:methylated-DNA-protein-cysteine methyltransferase-like protein
MRFADVYRVVRLIPRGMVMSYSGVARQCGRPGAARYVGFALHALLRSPACDRVPWWRVINAQGRISNLYAPEEQKRRLEAEGVVVGEDLRVDMRLFDAEAIVRRRLVRRYDRSPR